MNDIIYVDLECLLVNYDTCLNDPSKSHTRNIAQHIASGYSITALRNHIKSTVVTYYRGEDCIQKLCIELRKIATDLFNTEKLPVTPLTPEQKKEHSDSHECFICQKKFNYNKNSKYYKNLKKVKDHDQYTGIYRRAAYSLCNFRYSTQKDIPVVIHNGSNYDFHLIIKELANEFRSEIQCIPEDKEKYKTFSIPILYKELNDYEISYNLRFIYSYKFMIDSLENHINNLSELYVCDCKYKSNQQIKIKHNDKYIHTRCKSCTKRSKQSIKSLKNKFLCTFCLVNGNIDKFILLLKKGIYPYKYINDWKKFEETKLPSRNEFYSNLNLKNISKEALKHAQKAWKTFNIKNIGEYHDCMFNQILHKY